MSPEIERLLAGCTTVAARIRALDAAGYPRAEIARILGKRYQHVRNVLEEPGARPSPGVAERQRAFEGAPAREPTRVGNQFRLNVEADGSVRLPKVVLEAFGLSPGRIVVAALDGDEFTLVAPRESARRAQAGIPPWREGEPLWSEELIAERRREAARDDHES